MKTLVLPDSLRDVVYLDELTHDITFVIHGGEIKLRVVDGALRVRGNSILYAYGPGIVVEPHAANDVTVRFTRKEKP